MRPPRNSRTARVSAATRCSGPRPSAVRADSWSAPTPWPTVTQAGCRISAVLRGNASAITPVGVARRRVAWRAVPLPGTPVGARVRDMSHPDPAPADVRTVADHPLVGNGATSSLRMVAPGAVTDGRYGLVEYRVAPRSAGA